MIDQREHTRRIRLLDHAGRFISIQRHRLFAEHGFPFSERRESDFHVSGWRSDDADEIDVFVGYEFVPIGCDVLDAEFFCDCLGAFSMTTRNRDDLRAHAILKPRDLGRAGKPRPNNSDSDR